MKVIWKGIKLVCSQGQVNGQIMKDIPGNGAIGPKDFGLDSAAETIILATNDHICDQCGEQITQYRAGVFRVHTEGWIGQFNPQKAPAFALTRAARRDPLGEVQLA